jgi:prophage antirepressor-like protein
MNEVSVFENANIGSVRVVKKNCEPWFVAKDVLAAFRYSEEYNAPRALQAVPTEWKCVQPIHTLGGTQEMLTISGHGLYFFLGRSDKPAAIPYQRWIAGDVVPSIRKTGSYSVKDTTNKPRHGTPSGAFLMAYSGGATVLNQRAFL